MANKFVEPTQCPKCNGTMKPGVFMPKEAVAGYKGYKGSFLEYSTSIETWWEIAYFESNSFLGKGKGMALLAEEKPFQVIHYRCCDCGYLESYAPNPAD
ncbi:MAG: hypothetical protein U0Z26_15055 [Anaerolineales bacterium]